MDGHGDHRSMAEGVTKEADNAIVTIGGAKGGVGKTILAANLAMALADQGKKVIMIGNGGSAAIASHLSTDLWKNGGIRAMAFNDTSLLTCAANDFGYSEVFAQPTLRFADPGDLLIAISSSGKSPNILNGVE